MASPMHPETSATDTPPATSGSGYFTLANAESATQKIETMNASSAVIEALVGKNRMLACNNLYSSLLWKDIRFPVGRAFGDEAAVTCTAIGRCHSVGYTPESYYLYRERAGSGLNAVFLINVYSFLIHMVRYYFITPGENMFIENGNLTVII